MRTGHNHRARGVASPRILVVLTLLAVLCYVGIKLGMPYYAYRSLQSTMRQWARITLYQGGRNYEDLREKIQWTIERHGIPLDIDEVQIEYDPEGKILSVYAEYDVYVRFPGYEYHYFFQPYAEASAKDD